ncbi:hypothetical protein BJ944DRAFT_258262 [Cunninghamella echinulata]|nr:hypothetical protein BJ944DRAFT_258262 [Cunninghamella echinulata]
MVSDKVHVVLIEKENAIQSFQSLLTTQNSTKKKNRIIDPLSIYASTSQENTKRDIEILLKPIWDTYLSNNSGETVSSASFVSPSRTYENHDTVIHYASKEKLEKFITTVMDGKPNIENNEENNNKKLDLSHDKEKSAAIESLKSTVKISSTQFNTLENNQQNQSNILPPKEEKEYIKNDIPIMKPGLNKNCETKQEHSSLESHLINDDNGNYDEKSAINNNKDDVDPGETPIVTNNDKTSDFIQGDTHTTKEKDSNSINKVSDTSIEVVEITTNATTTTTTTTTTTVFTNESKEYIGEKSTDTIKRIVDTEKEVIDTTIATSNNNAIKVDEKNNNDNNTTNNESPTTQSISKENNGDSKNKNTLKKEEADDKRKKMENKNLTNMPTKTNVEIQKPKIPQDSKIPNKKIDNSNKDNINKTTAKYGSIKKRPSSIIQKQTIGNDDKSNKLTNIPSVRPISKVKDDNKILADKPTAPQRRIPRVALLSNDKSNKKNSATITTTTTTTTTESTLEPLSASHENVTTNQNKKSSIKPKKAATPSIIARLTAPTESSARRQQTIVNGKPVSPIANTTSTPKPSSTTAFIRLEGRKRVASSVSKKEISNSKQQPPSTLIVKKNNEKNIKKEDTKYLSKEASVEINSLDNGINTEQPLEVQTSQENLNANVIISTNELIQENSITDNNFIHESNKDNNNINKTEPLSPQSPESSTTSSRPLTPPHQEEGSTGVTLDTVNVKMKQGNSRVKDLLQRFA